ncbi:acyl-CoA thioesterase [Aquabacterium sp. OR-4]|uniref:acyl-CoA thioesterase n=1 Tax=Aquabacterium sp. OR-4 TaxID=2978127 RepID=UPI0021B2BF1A|nr:acyl-CoA thioesterase [Aquabacterium sp. OR-4]MDT7835771.1 acyl-CoA thioesterase [Aquabacterium sp. OR-4]
MSKLHVHRVEVCFGDCDPAGIVFFPNFSKWMDTASLAFFMACGVPPWRELVKTRGIIGTPLLEIHTRFMKPATYGETIEIHTSVEEWGRKTFRHRHLVRRGDELLCEGTETRAFCVRDADGRIRSIPIPEDIQALCL